MKKRSWPTRYTLYSSIGLAIAIISAFFVVREYTTVVCGQQLCLQTYPLQCQSGVCTLSANEANLYVAAGAMIIGIGLALGAAYKDFHNRKKC